MSPSAIGMLTAGEYSEGDAVHFCVEEVLKLPVISGDHLRDVIWEVIVYLALVEDTVSQRSLVLRLSWSKLALISYPETVENPLADYRKL
jgi:hypothetical protein